MFPIRIGTRQGSIASPSLWNDHLDPLNKALRSAGVGCHVGEVFLGVIDNGYADNLILLAPKRAAASQMLGICEAWAKESNTRTGSGLSSHVCLVTTLCTDLRSIHYSSGFTYTNTYLGYVRNVLFSTDPNPTKSKSKVIYMCGLHRQLSKPAPLTLCGRSLPYVASATHLGHELNETGTMEYDTRIKRAQFISNSLEIRELFSFASPAEVIRALKVYSCSFYGSNLWELGSNMAEKVYNAWGTAVRLSWSVPRATRSYLVDHVLSPDVSSARVDILAKFVGFFRSLRESSTPEVAFMAYLVGRDLRTTTGRNLRLIAEETMLDPWTVSPYLVKKALLGKATEIPEGDSWRIPYLRLLLEQRQSAHYGGYEEEETRLNELINALCIN